MSFLSDKFECSGCAHLYDPDQLNWQNVCRECVLDNEMLAELSEDYAREAQGMETREGQDPEEGLGAKHDSPVPKGGAQNAAD